MDLKNAIQIAFSKVLYSLGNEIEAAKLRVPESEDDSDNARIRYWNKNEALRGVTEPGDDNDNEQTEFRQESRNMPRFIAAIEFGM